MPTVMIDGIETRYEVLGSGPALLMYAPGGFDATIEKWSGLGIYEKVKPLAHLSRHYRCVVFDRRECGQSGGRVERITWDHYVIQGIGLLDHLGIHKAHAMGGCMGCCPAIAMTVTHPDRVLSSVFFWPVGGPHYRLNGHRRFNEHVVFAAAQGLHEVIKVAREGKSFGADPRGGPWASVIRRDPVFAARFAEQDLNAYLLIAGLTGRTLIDRDTSPGAEPEDMMRIKTPALIIPGSDASHATSAARYIQESISGAEYWDVPVSQQTEADTMKTMLEFLDRADG